MEKKISRPENNTKKWCAKLNKCRGKKVGPEHDIKYV